MAYVEQAAPPTAAAVVPSVSKPAAPPMVTRQDSLATVDMHIPGAWNGTNPSTPQPIADDIKYFGETLKTVPGTVQSYMLPKKENVAATGSTILNKAAGIVPASVMNTATNVLPKSMQPTMSPTAADANPPTHPTDISNEHPVSTTTNSIGHKELNRSEGVTAPAGSPLKDKAAGILPASVIGAAASYLPASMGGKTQASNSNSAASDVHPVADEPSTLRNTNARQDTKATDENQTGSTWTEKAKSALPVGAVGAAAAYLPSVLNPSNPSSEKQNVQPPAGHADAAKGTNDVSMSESHDNSTASGTSKPNGPLIGSTVSPDRDVQEALSKAVNPQEYKSEITSPMHISTAPSPPPKDYQTSIKSTQAVGGITPVTLDSLEAEGDGYPEKHNKGVSGLAAMAAGGGIGATVVDHGLKDQREAATKQHGGPSQLRETPATKGSFMHVVIPATPGAGLHEQEMFNRKSAKPDVDNTLSSEKPKKRDRSGSISAGEASPSSPSKSGMFSGIRKLTKKRDRSVSKGHDRKGSDAALTQGNHSDTRDSNSTGHSPTRAGDEKKERHVLHKDPPALFASGAAAVSGGWEQYTSPTSTTSANESHGSTRKREHDATPATLANSFSPNSPPSSPSKVGFRDKIKGEFMVVQGKLTKDEGLKEAGEKMKKGTM